MKVLFCGTPEFAVPTLEALVHSQYRPVLVVTQPDRPRGRGQRLKPSPVKVVAEQHGLPVHQPERFNTPENLQVLRDTGANLAVVVAYSAKIGKQALDLMPHGWLNLHPSLLPAYRGAAPLQWALINGEKSTGITTFFLNEEWDAGPICLQEEIPIKEEENYGELAERCAVSGARLILESIRKIQEGTVQPTPQDDSKATFAPLLRPEDSILDWNDTAFHIHCRVRGMSPKPGLFTAIGDHRVQILRTRVIETDRMRSASPGEIIECGRKGLQVAAGEGVIEILEIKPSGKKTMSGRDFSNGYRLRKGERFSKTLPKVEKPDSPTQGDSK